MVKNTFLVILFLQQFLFVGNDLSQYNMAKFSTTCLPKRCAAPSCVSCLISIETAGNSTNYFISLIFIEYFCIFGVKLDINELKMQDFESSVKIGHCVFVICTVLGQNVA